MKSYTDIEQSKKLAEFLSNESADMFFWKRTIKKDDYSIGVGHSKELQEGFTSKEIEYIPCWSLSALLRILPKRIGSSRLRIDISESDFNLWFENLSSGTVDETLPDITEENPVDACVEMILKLHEQKLL